MSRICPIAGKRTGTGNKRSHAMNATNRKFRPNMMVKRVFDPKLGKLVKMKISAAGLRTLSKAAR